MTKKNLKKVEEEKICLRCQKEIKDNERYYKLSLNDGEHRIDEKFFHEACWKVTMDSKSKAGYAFGVLQNLVGSLKEKGLYQEKFEV